MRTVNIIGAGLAGSILAKVLTSANIPIRVIDAEKDWRASIISENLFDNSWVPAIGEVRYNVALQVLQRYYPIDYVPFNNSKNPKYLYQIKPVHILLTDYIKDEITGYDENGCFSRNKTYEGVNVFCTGYWAKSLIKEKLGGLTGQGLIFRGQWKQPNLINFVTPRVHQKIFNWDDSHIWYGDSTCIIHENYLEKQEFYTQRCIERAFKLGLKNPEKIVYGIRPFVEGNKGFVKQLSKTTFINTGGWKCGLFLYAYQSQILLKWIKQLQ